jgi:hypothetical protein
MRYKRAEICAYSISLEESRKLRRRIVEIGVLTQNLAAPLKFVQTKISPSRHQVAWPDGPTLYSANPFKMSVWLAIFDQP